jgi:hypothetical protein
MQLRLQLCIRTGLVLADALDPTPLSLLLSLSLAPTQSPLTSLDTLTHHLPMTDARYLAPH